MGLVELPLIGRKFTWRRRNSCSKLDRVLVEPQWLQNVDGLKLVGLNCSLSDHVALLVKSEDVNWGPKPFRSIDAWFSHPGFLKFVEDEWKSCEEFGIMEKLRRLKQPLKKWNCDVFGHIDQNIKILEREIEEVFGRMEEDDSNEVNLARLNALKSYVQTWYVRKSSYWRQLSRERAIKGMDRNSKYFHAIATVRNKRKNIVQIRKGRRIIRSPRPIKKEVRNFYKSLYKQDQVPLISFPDNLVNRIPQQDASDLEVMPTDEEIKQAVWNCESSKAPGPDGFNFNFIKKCWHIMGNEFTVCIRNFFITGIIPRRANMTWVTLIPKREEAEEIKDYRPISMIGCFYKVVAKILANRMKHVLLDLVGDTLTAFVQGRQILDGALIANEFVHWVKKRKKETIIMKLDFQKVYDSIRWTFVDQVLQKMGFGGV